MTPADIVSRLASLNTSKLPTVAQVEYFLEQSGFERKTPGIYTRTGINQYGGQKQYWVTVSRKKCTDELMQREIQGIIYRATPAWLMIATCREIAEAFGVWQERWPEVAGLIASIDIPPAHE